MSRIRVDTDGLRNYVNSITGRIQEYEVLENRMRALNDSILASWKGDARDAFQEKMDQHLTQLKQLKEILNQYRDYARNAADKFENLDAQCAQQIRSSF